MPKYDAEGIACVVGHPFDHAGNHLLFPQEFEYDLVPSVPLPTIDISRSVRSELLNVETNKRWTRFLAKTRSSVFILYNTSLLLNLLIVCTNIRVLRWAAIPSAIISTYAIAIQISLMHFDVLRILSRTYEFWFIAVVNGVSTVLISMYIPDLRAMVMCGMWIGYRSMAMIDAQIVFQRELHHVSLVPVVFTTAIVCCVGLEVIDGVNNFPLFRVNGYELDARVAILNGYSTQQIILSRNTYRLREVTKEHGYSSTTMQCITYRCPVRLRISRRQVDSSSVMSGPTNPVFLLAADRKVQMQCPPVHLEPSTKLLVVSMASRLLDDPRHFYTRAWRIAASTTSSIGIILNILSCIPFVASSCRVIGFASTLLFCILSASTYYRQVLRYLVFSFDFAFLSVQFTAIHVCLCDLLGWDSRMLTVLSSWLWIHWVLMFDCMPVAIKKQWVFTINASCG